MSKEAHLVLADGTRFSGTSFGAEGVATGEAVFTTGMTGYEEVLTDPSYCGQIVTMTAPQIGNTGITLEDAEARRPALRGFVVRELSAIESNWRTKESLDAYLERMGIVGITGVDTRTLTRHIRDRGAQMAAVGTEDPATLHDRAKAAPPMTGQNLTGEVTTPEVYQWTEGTGVWSVPREGARPWHVGA
ncbi:MAG: carbamoyl-phosphate synthase domain-containing protein, partial [Polyangiales bacterium]